MAWKLLLGSALQRGLCRGRIPVLIQQVHGASEAGDFPQIRARPQQRSTTQQDPVGCAQGQRDDAEVSTSSVIPGKLIWKRRKMLQLFDRFFSLSVLTGYRDACLPCTRGVGWIRTSAL